MGVPLADAIAIVSGVIEQIPELPLHGKGVQELLNGDMMLNEEGVWIFSFSESYQYAVRTRLTHPSESLAEIIYGIQVKGSTLDDLVSDRKYQSALAVITHAFRKKFEAESGLGTFVDSSPSFEVKMTGSEQFFADAFNLGVIQITLVLAGYDDD